MLAFEILGVIFVALFFGALLTGRDHAPNR